MHILSGAFLPGAFLRSLIKLKLSGVIYSYPLAVLVEIYVAALGRFAFVFYVVSLHLNFVTNMACRIFVFKMSKRQLYVD